MNKNFFFNYNVALMRLVSTLAVVMIHTATAIFYVDLNDYNYFVRLFYILMNTLGRFAVPCFFMITGYLLLGKNYSYKAILLKCLNRAIIPLFIFGTFYSLLEIYFDTKTINLFESIIRVLTMRSWDHMWYLYSLIAIYLLFPLFEKITNLKKTTLISIMVVLYVVDFIIPSINRYFSLNINDLYANTYVLFYLLFGYYFRKYGKKKNIICYFVLFLSLIISIINTLYKIGPTTIDNKGIINSVYAICWFVLIMNMKIENNYFLKKINEYCFFVYLIHPLFINVVYKYFGFVPLYYKHPIIIFLILYIIFILSSFISSYIIGMIKPFKKFFR